jgi:hypothetical protein
MTENPKIDPAPLSNTEKEPDMLGCQVTNL